MFISHLYVLFGEMSKSFAHFLIGSFIFLVLSCMNCLYILEINSLSFNSFAIIFSHFEGCLFSLLIVSFILQKLLSLIRSCLFIFVFISIIIGDRPKNNAVIYVKNCSDLFFSSGFIMSGFTFRSMLSLFLSVVLENVLISLFYM